MHVLVVDDNLLSRTRLASQVREAGWQITVAAPDPDVLTRLRDNMPDAVVVNLAAGPPTSSGPAAGEDRPTRFVQALRGTMPWTDLPVLGFCGHTDRRRREAGLASGCTKVETTASVAAGLAQIIRTLTAAGSIRGGN